MKLSRYRAIKRLILLSITIYIVTLYLHHNSIVASNKLEIYPFAGWRLFSYTPKHFGIESAVVLDSINGRQADIHYLIPNNNSTSIDDQSVTGRTASACAVSVDCSEAEELLFPVIERLTAERYDENLEDIEFSIIRVRIDYSDILDHIKDLAEGTVIKSDFYKPVQTIGRWSTRNGRIMDVSLLEGNIPQYQSNNDQASTQDSISANLFQDTAVLASESHFTIYLDGDNLVYVRPSCTQADTETRFFLHIIPYYLNDLPENRRQVGFDNLDFNFQNNYIDQGVGEEYNCVTVQKLPEYEISGIRTGQFSDGVEFWSTQFAVAR